MNKQEMTVAYAVKAIKSVLLSYSAQHNHPFHMGGAVAAMEERKMKQ